jgi:hypothetical protein
VINHQHVERELSRLEFQTQVLNRRKNRKAGRIGRPTTWPASSVIDRALESAISRLPLRVKAHYRRHGYSVSDGRPSNLDFEAGSRHPGRRSGLETRLSPAQPASSTRMRRKI